MRPVSPLKESLHAKKLIVYLKNVVLCYLVSGCSGELGCAGGRRASRWLRMLGENAAATARARGLLYQGGQGNKERGETHALPPPRLGTRTTLPDS